MSGDGEREVDRQARPRRSLSLGVLLHAPGDVEEGLGGIETAIYLVVAALLLAAAGFTLVGTVIDVFQGSKSRPIADTGVFLLDRVLLLFIIAELLYTLRVVNIGGQVLVEPFLFIGLIAVVRKVLVLTAEFAANHEEVKDFVLQIAALSGLAIVLAASIYILRRTATLAVPPDATKAP